MNFPLFLVVNKQENKRNNKVLVLVWIRVILECVMVGNECFWGYFWVVSEELPEFSFLDIGMCFGN